MPRSPILDCADVTLGDAKFSGDIDLPPWVATDGLDLVVSQLRLMVALSGQRRSMAGTVKGIISPRGPTQI
jgi:hypothetical protein